MLNLQLAQKYATAIFEIAIEDDKLIPYGEELATVRENLFNIPQARSFFQNPQIQNEAKKELLTKCFKGEVSKVIFNFLLLLVDKRRIGIFEAIEEEYRKLSNRERGILIADVTTSKGMNRKQQEQLQKKLASITNKKVQLRMHEDENILGGVIVKIGDKRIDGSIAGKLTSMRQQLMLNQN